MHRVTITEPCKINGQDHSPGETLDLEDNIAMDVISANRGTIDPRRAAAAVAAAAAAAAAVAAAAPAVAAAAADES